MGLNEEKKNELINKYRTELYENDNADIKKLNDLISDDDLRSIIMLNNKEIAALNKKQPVDVELLKRLLIASKNFYKIAKYRELSIPGYSFLMPIADKVGYGSDRLYSELNVGAYYRPHRPKR